MVICRNADPFLDGFGIILTMQIPSRLHVIEASKAFSKIAFVKELPVCSSTQRKNTLLNKSTRPLYVPAMARRLPKPLKEKVLKCDGKLIKFYVLTIILKDTQNKAETDTRIQARFPSICSGLQDGSRTRHRQSKTDSRRPKAPPRPSRWLQGASQTAQDGPQIDENP